MLSPDAQREMNLSTKLATAMKQGSTRGIETVLAAGASVDGSRYQQLPPLILAVVNGYGSSMVKFLIKKGADVNGSIARDPTPRGAAVWAKGERALHTAARHGCIDTVKALLRADADPNATDGRGRTPLVAAFVTSADRISVAQVLIEAGADPALADDNGFLPLHHAACHGGPPDIEFLLSHAPTVLNDVTVNGSTPLLMAAMEGRENEVRCLLSAGARQPPQWRCAMVVTCPLCKAIDDGHENVVRILLGPTGMEAIGDSSLAIPPALYAATIKGRARMLDLMLSMEREQIREQYARFSPVDAPLLHVAATRGFFTTASVLLAAGARDTDRNNFGQTAMDAVGFGESDRVNECAVRRVLERSPAYRARSWAWPAAGMHGGGAAGSQAIGDTILSCSRQENPLLVRVYRPKERYVFGKLVGR